MATFPTTGQKPWGAVLKAYIDDLVNGRLPADAVVPDANLPSRLSAVNLTSAQQAAIDTAITNLRNGVPAAMDTLKELADALASDETAAGALTTLVTQVRNLTDPTIAASLSAAFVALGSTPPGAAMVPTAPQQTMWVQSFASGSVTGAASSNLADTSDVLLGTTTATMTTDGAQTIANLSVTGLSAVDFTGRYPKVWVKVSDPIKLSSLKVLLGNGGFANYYNLAAQQSTSAGTAGLQVIQANVWTPITLGWGEALTVGSPNRTSIDSLRVQIKDTGSGNAVTVKVAGVAHLPEPSEAFPNGVVTLCFDDGYASQYTAARPILDAKGMTATIMPIVDLVDSGANWITAAQLRELQDKHGWEVAGHAATQAHHDNRLTSLTTAQLKADFATNRAWLQANGFRGWDITAYPGGIYNASVKQVAQSYWSSARGVISNTHETFPAGDPYLVRGYPCDNTTGGPTLANIQAAVDAAYANKGWLNLVLHDIQGSASANSIQWSTANLQALVDYIAAKGIPVRNYGDVLREKRVGAPNTKVSTLADVSLGTLTNGDVVTYDSTAGKWKNAQPSGGAGGSGTATGTWGPEDSGLLAWTEDPVHCNATIAGVSGTIYLQKLKITKTCTISSILRYLNTSGAGLTAGQNFDGLYDALGNRLGVTGDMTSAWSSGAGAFVTGTLTSPVTITVTGAPVYIYAAFVSVGTTPPTFLRGQNILNATTTNAGLTAAGGLRFSSFGSGQSALPATIALGSAVSNANPFLVLLK